MFMNKAQAIELLGGIHEAAKAVRVTYQAVKKWPDPLSERIQDRVTAALLRKAAPQTKKSAKRSSEINP